MICKFQRSQAPHHDSVLIYSKHGRNGSVKINGRFTEVHYMGTLSGELAATFDKHGEKFFAECSVDEQSHIVLERVLASDQGW